MTKTINDPAASSSPALPPLTPARRRYLPPAWIFLAAGLVFVLCYPAAVIGRGFVMAVYLRQAEDAYNAGNIPDATRNFNSAIGMTTDNEEPYAKRWTIARQTGDLQAALSDFDAAVAEHPSASLPYCYRAQVYRALEQYEQSIPDYEACIRNGPNNAWRIQAPTALENVKKKLAK